MNRQTTRDQFLEAAADWICDSYSLGINYLATTDQGVLKIIDASLSVQPLPPIKKNNFMAKAGNLLVGQEIIPSLSSAEILTLLENAINGELNVNGLQLKIHTSSDLDYYSETSHQNTWFSELHLLVSGSKLNVPSASEITSNDNSLRCSTTPFDGLADLCSWLQLTDGRTSGRAASINLRVGPPVDMIFESSNLHDNNFKLALTAHPKFDISKVGLATREFPGSGLESRKQSSKLISWKRIKGGLRPGLLGMKLANADSVLAMLTVGGRTIRRQWFNDPNKAINARYVATQLFDKDLKQLRQAVLEPTDSFRFEQGIASLLYLLGFSNAIQVETQAPDILVTSPNGKVAIVECTMKISDFQTKLGKLVDRRNALMASLNATGHNLRVDAFLACGLPKAQIAIEDRQLINHKVTLLCREDISNAFLQLRIPTNPDDMLDKAAAKLTEVQNSIA